MDPFKLLLLDWRDAKQHILLLYERLAEVGRFFPLFERKKKLFLAVMLL